MQSLKFDEQIDKIVAADPRFHRDAYSFVREALDYTQKNSGRSGAPSRSSKNLNEMLDPSGKDAAKTSHVSGKQLLEGIREYALDRYGPMTITLFEEWGIHRCEDFGDIVFNMVESSILGKTEEDSREDFKNGYDFVEAFRKPFLPSAKQPPHPAPVAE